MESMGALEALFVYGTLQDADVQRRVFGRTVEGTPDVLDGYRKAQITLDGVVYPIAVADSMGTISGRILDVTAHELIDMDAYEGKEYRRVRVILRSGVETWVYCA